MAGATSRGDFIIWRRETGGRKGRKATNGSIACRTEFFNQLLIVVEGNPGGCVGLCRVARRGWCWGCGCGMGKAGGRDGVIRRAYSSLVGRKVTMSRRIYYLLYKIICAFIIFYCLKLYSIPPPRVSLPTTMSADLLWLLLRVRLPLIEFSSPILPSPCPGKQFFHGQTCPRGPNLLQGTSESHTIFHLVQDANLREHKGNLRNVHTYKDSGLANVKVNSTLPHGASSSHPRSSHRRST